MYRYIQAGNFTTDNLKKVMDDKERKKGGEGSGAGGGAEAAGGGVGGVVGGEQGFAAMSIFDKAMSRVKVGPHRFTPVHP